MDIHELNLKRSDNVLQWFHKSHETIDIIEDYIKTFIDETGFAVHPSAKVHPSAIIGDNVFIGEGVVIGPYSYIKSNSMLLTGVKIGYLVELDRCIIFDNTKIAHQSCIGRCIIGENCNLAFGFVVATKKLNGKAVKSFMDDQCHTSQRSHHGCVIGNKLITGVNVSVMPGTTILNDVVASPNTTLSGFINAEQFVK